MPKIVRITGCDGGVSRPLGSQFVVGNNENNESLQNQRLSLRFLLYPCKLWPRSRTDCVETCKVLQTGVTFAFVNFLKMAVRVVF